MTQHPSRMLAAAFILAVMATAGCGSSSERKVVFEVSGPPSADITYGLGADQSQENGAVLPWKKEVSSKGSLLITVITAQSKSNGEISCKITIDGKVAKENKSSGEFAVVTCSNG